MNRWGGALWWLLLSAGMALAQTRATIVDHACVDQADRVIPTAALDAVRTKKILFGHESVGWDVIGGLERLSQEQPGRYRLAIQHLIETPWFHRHNGLGEFFFRSNGRPVGKVEAFVDKVRGGCGQVVDVAMMKFCYADFTEQSDPAGAFAAWRGAYERLERDFPRVSFVWWTCPLVQSTRCGDKRTAINNLIRDYCRREGRPLLDVADLECHDPEGRKITAGGCEMLYEGYSRDAGGHLNNAGAQRVGRAWWWLLARLSGWPGPA